MLNLIKQTVKQTRVSRKGFTLVELLVVIAVIGILFVTLISKVNFATDKAKMTGVQTALRQYYIAASSVAREGDIGNMSKQKFEERLNSFLDDNLTMANRESGITDPWGSHYRYAINKSSGMTYVMFASEGTSDMSPSFLTFTNADDFEPRISMVFKQEGSEILPLDETAINELKSGTTPVDMNSTIKNMDPTQELVDWPASDANNYVVPDKYADRNNGGTGGNGGAGGEVTPPEQEPAEDLSNLEPDQKYMYESSKKGMFEIANPHQLYLFSDWVNGYYNAFEVGDKTISGEHLNDNAKLTASFSLVEAYGSNWIPIGNEKAYTGTFDGCGLEITNVCCEAWSSLTPQNFNRTPALKNIGLFGINNGTIKNLTLEGYFGDSEHVIGGIACKNNGTITNCTSKAITQGGQNCGGAIAGENNGTISSCTVYDDNSLKTWWGNNLGWSVSNVVGRITFCGDGTVTSDCKVIKN